MGSTRTRLDPAQRRESILQAGLRVFGRQPYEACSIDDVALEAGMSTGLLYHYFPGKQALFSATYEHLAAQVLAVFASRAGQAPWALIEGSLDAYLKFAQRHPKVILMLLRPTHGGPAEQPSMNDRLNGQIAGLIAAGFGLRASDVRRRTAIRAWLAFVDRVVLDMLTQGKPSRAQVKALSLSVLSAALDVPKAPGEAPA